MTRDEVRRFLEAVQELSPEYYPWFLDV